MAISIKHKFVSLITDDEDDTLVRPSEWNEDHDLILANDKLIGRATTGTGPAEEISCTAAGRTLIAATDAAAQRAALSLAAAALLDIASQAEAEAGSANDKVMTPLRVAQAIAALASGGVPVGTIADFAGTTEPDGWLFCFGQAVSRTTYADLFAELSTTYGSGDGSTTFNLPDCRGRVRAGKDNMGGTSANRLTSPINGDNLGATGGSESHALTAAQIPNNAIAALFANQVTGPQAASSGHTGTGSEHPNVQPTIIFNTIIYTGVTS